MSSPGQRRRGCGHVMANFDWHSYCARCCEKNKGKDLCVENKDTTTCKFCLALTPDQIARISTPSYKLKKEKREARKSDTATPTKEASELVDPANVSVIGVVGQQDTVKSPSSSVLPEKKQKKDKPPSKTKKSSDSRSTDSKIAELDSKWSYQSPCNLHFLQKLKWLLIQHLLTFPGILSPFSNPLGALARTSLQKCISQPAGVGFTDYFNRAHWQGFLCFTASTSQPAHIRPTETFFII